MAIRYAAGPRREAPERLGLEPRSLTKFVAGDFLRIANVEPAVGDYGVVPGLPRMA